MKYKKHIATGALALSLLVSGSSVFAATPQDLGIKNSQSTYQKQNRSENKNNIRRRGKRNVVGIISAISSTGFTLEIKNQKNKISSSVDIKTNNKTTYSKNGIGTGAFALAPGQKVVIVGKLDKTTNILTAKKVKIVLN